MVTTDLSLTFPNLVLPGHAGMDLVLAWTWSPTQPWRLGIAGVPTWISNPNGAGEVGGDGPFLMTSDGTKHPAYADAGLPSGVFVTREFWRYTASTRTVQLPNGWTATYENGLGQTFAMLVSVQDVYDNVITPTWIADGVPAQRLSSVVQQVGTNSRTVTFEWWGGQLHAMRFVGGAAGGADRTWTYEYYGSALNWHGGGLSAINPPAGASWRFTYDTYWIQVTTPNGGTIKYTTEESQFFGGRMVLRQRTTSGRAIPTPSTWTFFSHIDEGAGTATGTVSLPGPGSRSLLFEHDAVTASSMVGDTWQLTHRALRSAGNTVSATDVSHIALPVTSTLSASAVQQSVLHQDDRDYTTTLSYDTTYHPDHPAAFHQPLQIQEASDLTRTTARTFRYDFTPYTSGAVATETITVASVGSTQNSYGYELANGFRTSQTMAGVTTSFGRDNWGNLATVTDANLNTTSMSYVWGAAAVTQTPMYTITRSINPDGTVASETRRGLTTEYQYDAAGRPTLVDPPLGLSQEISYDNTAGAFVTVTRGQSATTTAVDGFGRTVLTSTAGGNQVATVYDVLGRVTVQGLPQEQYGYDHLDRVTSITRTGGGVIQFGYAGNDVSITDENSHTTVQHWKTFGSPGDRRLGSLTDAAGQPWQYSYNVFGRLTRVDAPEGPDRIWEYDTKNRLERDIQPESGTTQYWYDPGGRLIKRKDANLVDAFYAYDANDRLTSTDLHGDDHDWTYGYDASDNRRSMVNTHVHGASTFFTFDDANRLTRRRDQLLGHTLDTDYAYDDEDRLTQITYPSGRIVSYSYNVDGQGTAVTGPNGIVYADQISYHPAGGIASYRLGNGRLHTVAVDALQRPTRLKSGPVDVTYGYDPASNVASITDRRNPLDPEAISPEFSSSYHYDALDRLTTVGGFGGTSFTYDALGNRLTKGTTSYNTDPNTQRLMQTTGEYENFLYDANGNLKEDGTFFYYYRPDNMMRASVQKGTTPVLWTIFQYDGDGQRIARWNANGTFITTTGAAGLPMTEYGLSGWQRDSIYLGSQLLATVRPAVATALTLQNLVGTWWILGEDQVWRSCTIASEGGTNILITNEWGDATHGTFNEPARTITAGPEWGSLSNDVSANLNRLVWQNGTVWVRGTNPIPDEYVFDYFHPDMLGSVRAVTDHGGQTLARHDYFPFGEGPTVTAASEKQRFTGEERDAETLLDYFGARYARSTTGRFLTVDPVVSPTALVYPRQWNRYTYVSNNPLRRIDPDGRYERDVHFHLTRVLAIAAGYSPAQAEQIARGNQGTDEDPATEPLGPLPCCEPQARREGWHFTTAGRRDELFRDYQRTGNLEAFGRYLHAQQDSFSHRDFGPTWGHLKAGTAPDKTYNNPERANEMAADSYQRLSQGGSRVYSAVPWHVIARFVDQFNRARTNAEKMQILQAMLSALEPYRSQ